MALIQSGRNCPDGWADGRRRSVGSRSLLYASHVLAHELYRPLAAEELHQDDDSVGTAHAFDQPPL
jgi:hypothetical protein